MEATLENVALITIALASVAIIGAVMLSLMGTQVQLMKQDVIVKVHDVERHNDKTWFVLSVTYGGKIDSVEVKDTIGSKCSLNSDPYSQGTWEIYGFCDGNSDVLIITVTGSSGRAETVVKL